MNETNAIGQITSVDNLFQVNTDSPKDAASRFYFGQASSIFGGELGNGADDSQSELLSKTVSSTPITRLPALWGAGNNPQISFAPNLFSNEPLTMTVAEEAPQDIKQVIERLNPTDNAWLNQRLDSIAANPAGEQVLRNVDASNSILALQTGQGKDSQPAAIRPRENSEGRIVGLQVNLNKDSINNSPLGDQIDLIARAGHEAAVIDRALGDTFGTDYTIDARQYAAAAGKIDVTATTFSAYIASYQAYTGAVAADPQAGREVTDLQSYLALRLGDDEPSLRPIFQTENLPNHLQAEPPKAYELRLGMRLSDKLTEHVGKPARLWDVLIDQGIRNQLGSGEGKKSIDKSAFTAEVSKQVGDINDNGLKPIDFETEVAPIVNRVVDITNRSAWNYYQGL